MIDIVRKRVSRDDIRVLTDTVTVIGCNITEIDIHSRIGINSQALPEIIETAKKQFIEKFELAKRLGRSVTKSWIIANLFVEGVKFQRLRGTPALLKIALKWANIEDITIIEEPPGKYFFELQIGIKDVPNNFFVDAVIELAKLSLPARSRLMRIFNDHYNIVL